MNLRVVLGGSVSLAAASTGGYMLLGPRGSTHPTGTSPVPTNIIDSNESIDKSPNIDEISPVETPPRGVMMVIQRDNDGAMAEAIAKYGKHFDRKIGEFVSGSGLEIPNEDNWDRVYGAWEGKGEELMRRYKKEYGEEVTSDYVDPGNIETALRMVIFRVCSGEDDAMKLRHCMVREGDMSQGVNHDSEI